MEQNSLCIVCVYSMTLLNLTSSEPEIEYHIQYGSTVYWDHGG